MSDRLALGMACLTFALQLRNGELDEMTLAELRERSERLPADDALRLAVTHAAVQAEIASPDRVRAIGTDLHDRLMILMRPEPPGQDRRDIHG